MASTGVAYSGLKALNLKLGGPSAAPAYTINVQSTAAGTTSTITAQTFSNTWNVGSLAPTVSGGVLDNLAGPLVLVGNGDTLNIDDTGSAVAKTGTLTDSTLTGFGTGGITFSAINTLNMDLGSHGNTLTLTVTNSLPATTNIALAATSSSDSVTGTFAHDFNGALNLVAFEQVSLTIAGGFAGALSVTAPGAINLLSVGGSLAFGSSITATSITTLHVGVDVDISVILSGALGTATVGGTVPGGVAIEASSIGSLTIGPANTASAGHDLAGDVSTTGALGILSVSGDVSGHVSEELTTQSIYIGGSLLTSGIRILGDQRDGRRASSISEDHRPGPATGLSSSRAPWGP